MPQQKLGLFGRNAAIWRAKKHRLCLSGTLPNVVKVGQVFGNPTIDVIHGMVADGMSSVFHLLENLGVLLNVVPHTEESRFGIVLFQLLQYPRCNFRNWAIVKSEEDLFLFGRYPPSEVGKQVLDKMGSLDQIHKC